MTTSYFRGIVGFRVDPQFSTHPFVYVAYTPRLPGVKPAGPTVDRISRFRVVDGRADLSSERVLVGAEERSPVRAAGLG